ncbi:type II toxin-antitoxin system VapC family toxin [Thermomonas carbonis]|uniref:VapC toxin family PIN domain ribonuclease n=1 Tax=Thermomonas carbonis TaxID=1463158 RepID=A0A7G9SPC2_9GAMM|nr:PIN domain-containing protein [Thermomonas carbonis]QNN69697.1 VapC toxin family PIN domain ribonuclease [Thermomonas carbonis]GHB94900.1 twitching motility protein PilT [Thermomonas carbonis]
MNVLVDTSVWVDHFRNGQPALAQLLALDVVLIHPWVLAELACGTPPAPRRRTLDDIARLRPAVQASQAELLDFIEREKLHGLGCGMVDVALLASTLLTPRTRLWTLDKRLAVLADRYGVAHLPVIA